jgi:hypothetical protein
MYVTWLLISIHLHCSHSCSISITVFCSVDPLEVNTRHVSIIIMCKDDDKKKLYEILRMVLALVFIRPVIIQFILS